MTSTFPATIAGFHVERKLSAGAIGTVLLASRRGSHGFEKRVAIKVLHAEHFTRSEIRQLFTDEARLAAQLSHPNICQVFDFGEEQGLYYIIMEYVEGERLIDIMRTHQHLREPMPQELAARVVADAARGLHYAHELRGPSGELLNVVHRDISPDNIIVTTSGTTKVLDFGIARWADRLTVTRQNIIRGKAAYMSPEQVRGRSLDRRSDIFALGVIFYELLTIRHLFKRTTILETMSAVDEVTPPDLSRPGPPLDPGITAVVLRALERDPSRRFTHAEEMTLALEQVVARLGRPSTTEALAHHLRSVIRPEMERTAPPPPRFDLSGDETTTSDALGPPPRPATEVLDAAPGQAELSAAGADLVTAGDATTPGSQRQAPLEATVRSRGPASRKTDNQMTERQPPRAANRPAKVMVALFGFTGILAAASVGIWIFGTSNDKTPVQPHGQKDAAIAPSVATPHTAITETAPPLAAHTTLPDRTPLIPDRQAAAAIDPPPRRHPLRKQPERRPAPPPPPDRISTGTVSVFATPWGNVRIDGELIGPTPLFNHTLSEGAHVVEVVTPDTHQVVERRTVRIKAGEKLRVEVRR